jgi:hypothetical protein
MKMYVFFILALISISHCSIEWQKQKLNQNYLSLNNNSLNIGVMVPSLVSPTALTILARQTLQ